MKTLIERFPLHLITANWFLFMDVLIKLKWKHFKHFQVSISTQSQLIFTTNVSDRKMFSNNVQDLRDKRNVTH